MRDRLIELIDEYTDQLCARDIHQADFAEKFADHLLAEGVIVPPRKVEPITTVFKKTFHNRIEVVKNTRYEWNEAQFCFSESEADGVEARWKALAERTRDDTKRSLRD